MTNEQTTEGALAFRRRLQLRDKHDGYGSFPTWLLETPQYRALSQSGLRVLNLAISKSRADNNGDIHLTATWAETQGLSGGSLSRGIKECLDQGLLVKTRPGQRGGQGPRQPSLYALGWQPIPDNPKLKRKLTLVQVPSPPSFQRPYGNSNTASGV